MSNHNSKNMRQTLKRKMAESFLDLVKDINSQILEDQRIPL